VKILVSWSSGKDSAWMLHVLRMAGHVPAALLTTTTEAYGRVSMHGVRTTVLEAQARAAGLPLITVPLPTPCHNDEYEQRMGGAVETAVEEGFTHVAFGDLFLEDVRAYRESRLAGTGLTAMFPLWGRPTGALAEDMIAAGLEATLTCIDPRILPRSLAGRHFDRALFAELPPGTDPCGERGEFHTCVTAGPMFSAPIAVRPGDVVEREGFVFVDLLLTPTGDRE
jgi:uncharacterized protein (TIGR00290 family)